MFSLSNDVYKCLGLLKNILNIWLSPRWLLDFLPQIKNFLKFTWGKIKSSGISDNFYQSLHKLSHLLKPLVTSSKSYHRPNIFIYRRLNFIFIAPNGNKHLSSKLNCFSWIVLQFTLLRHEANDWRQIHDPKSFIMSQAMKMLLSKWRKHLNNSIDDRRKFWKNSR